METVTGFIGRQRETGEAMKAIRQHGNLLVSGPPGIGKSAFLAHLRDVLPNEPDMPPMVWIPAGTTKIVLMEAARQVHEHVGLAIPAEHLPPRVVARFRRQGWLPWKDLVRTVRRLSVNETVDFIVASFAKRRLLVFLESLEVPPSQANLFARLIDAAQVVAGMDDNNRRVRIDRLLWRFPTRLELKPLPLEDCIEITGRWLADHPLRFATEKTRRRFVQHVARDSRGNPAAVRGMLEAAANETEITPAKARAFHHEAGVRFVDLTPLLVVGMVGFLAMRYISRGAGMTELYVLSGVATAIFIGLRMFMYKMGTEARR